MLNIPSNAIFVTSEVARPHSSGLKFLKTFHIKGKTEIYIHRRLYQSLSEFVSGNNYIELNIYTYIYIYI